MDVIIFFNSWRVLKNWKGRNNRGLMSFMDSKLDRSFKYVQSRTLIKLAVFCLEKDRSKRPTMEYIIKTLLEPDEWMAEWTICVFPAWTEIDAMDQLVSGFYTKINYLYRVSLVCQKMYVLESIIIMEPTVRSHNCEKVVFRKLVWSCISPLVMTTSLLPAQTCTSNFSFL